MSHRKVLLLLLALFTLFIKCSFAQKANKNIVGYFPSWEIHERKDLLRPSKDNIDFSKYTMLNYCFFKTDSKGFVSGNHQWIDSICIKGELNWSKTQTTLDTRIPTRQLEELMFKGDENWSKIYAPYFKPNSSLIDRAHLWGVPVLLSIGGPDNSKVFPEMVSDPENRKRFAEECVRILKHNKFDGIEIHWQFPGYLPENGTPDDKKNFTSLLKDVRNALDEYGAKIKYRFYLTASIGASENNMENIEWKKVSPLLDQINISTYQYSGKWGAAAHHLSPLLSGTNNEFEVSYSDVYNRMTKLHNVPKSKINIGIGYFGRSVLFNPGQAELNKKTKQMLQLDSIIPAYSIMLDSTNYSTYWDSVSLATYRISNDQTTFISYESDKSLDLKSNYVLRNNLAGITIWDISNEFYLTNNELIKSIGYTDIIRSILEPEIQNKIKKRWK